MYMKRKTYRRKRSARVRRNTRRRRGGSSFEISIRPSQFITPNSKPDLLYRVQRFDNDTGKPDCFTKSVKKTIGYVEDWLTLLSKGPKYITDKNTTHTETFKINDK